MAVRKLSCPRGQMTVELCVVLPVVIVIAAIAYNALAFFSHCAAFDRDFRDAARTLVVAPPASEGIAAAVEDIKGTAWAESFDDNPAISLEYESGADGTITVKGTLEYRPTLFGLQTRGEVFGVGLPTLSHSSQIVLRSDGDA